MDRARAGYRCAQGYRTPGYLWLLDRALGRQCGDLDHGAPDDWPGLCFFSPPARPPARCCRTHTRIHRTAPRSTRCGSQIWRAHGSPVACTCTADGGARDSLLPCMCHFGLIVARRDTQSVGIPVARSSPHQPTDGRTASMPPSKTCPRSRRPCWRDDDDDQQSRGFNLAPGAKAGRPPSKHCCQSTMADEPLSSGTDA